MFQILSPTVHFPRLKEALSHLKRANFPLPIVFKSSGFELAKEIEEFESLVDIYIPDFKPCLVKNWSKRARVGENYQDYFELAINEMQRQVGKVRYDEDGIVQKGVIIRYVKPSFASLGENKQIVSYLNRYKDQAYVSIMDNFVSLE